MSERRQTSKIKSHPAVHLASAETPPLRGSARRTPADKGHDPTVFQPVPAGAALFHGGGEMGELIRAFDWSRTPLGATESWSPALRMMVRFLLANRFPLLLWWGPDYVSIYNDAYRPILGAKHPSALGQPVRECWNEIWHILKPLIDTPFEGGPATWNDDIFLEINRHGFVEETHFTIAYSPVPDETAPNGIGGVMATVHEITEKVVGERRIVVLRDLGARVSEAKTAEEACAIAARTLEAHDRDVPFALFYLFDDDGVHARLAGATGAGLASELSPRTVDLTREDAVWPLAEVRRSETMQVMERLSERLPAVPRGPWSDAPHTAMVVPIPSTKPHQPVGAIVAGVSPRLKLDPFYRDFFELLRTQVASAIASAHAYEEERKRAEALAEIDRAKTAFFSNVSHEFRTPLTLMLGPIEDELRNNPSNARLELAHRNSLRLLKLVNTLLDFARIEAGRIQASYEATDLSALTCDIASSFRSAVENAGLELAVECPPLPEPVFVDREMWEKVVLNLLSNAFKFTFEGGIKVQMRWLGNAAELRVTDSGTGIPPEEVPHLFERFHRVRGARSRTHEGTGIGLAFVQELVRLHGGDVRIESVVDQGSTFTVTMPAGSAHLPQDIVGTRPDQSAGIAATVFVEEAMQWSTDAASTTAGSARSASATRPASDSPEKLARIILADDNTDMREYVARLLGESYDVIAVPNGRAALDAARERGADLILSDVMMPVLDGFGLLREIRSNTDTRTVPVILLSARAGEESRVEGLAEGADDYLVKPFTARELLARVESHLRLARLRRDTEHRVAEILSSITDGFHLIDANWRFTQFNGAARRMFAAQGIIAESLIGKHLLDEAFPQDRELPAVKALERTMSERVPTEAESFYEPWNRWLRVRHFPTADGGAATLFQDVTERRQAEEAVRVSEQRLQAADIRKDEFLATLAHELRNPLAPVRHAAEVLRLIESNEPRVRWSQGVIERQVEHLTRLIDDLMDVSRITRNKLEIRTQHLDLVEVINAAIESSRPLIEQYGHELVVSLPEEHIYLNGDLVRLAQVFLNLLNNAAKYTERGGHIWLTAKLEDGDAVVTVKDSGVGIPTEKLPHLFEMFFQASGSERSQGGLGIGLSLVRRLVELHGGSVKAVSAGAGTGSEFTVRLPAFAGKRAVDTSTHGKEASPARRILVVDDNRDSADSLAMLLQVMGHDVVAAYDGIQGIATAEQSRFDVALLDIGMPGLNGCDVCRRIRTLDGGRDMVLIALTGWGQEEDRRATREAGFNAHMVKPVDPDALLRLLTELTA